MSKIYVYHHNDHDGIVAAGILRHHLFEVEKRKLEDLKFITIDYSVDLNFDHIDFENRDKVYFLDYSFSNKHNQEEFKKLLDRRKVARDVKWIDHHKTSIGMFSEYDIPGIRNVALCGAAWTYLYCNGEYKNLLDKSIEEISDYFHDSHLVPTFLKYIDDYDCWKGIYGDDTNYFHYGFDVSSPMAVVIRKLLVNGKPAAFRIIDYIKAGEIIVNYNKINDKAYHVDMYGFEFTLPEEHGGLKCFCLNRKGGSHMFGDKVNEYDAVIPFYFKDGKWTYSIFSTKEEVDCSQIAKTYGGGGHKGAAGWVIKEFIFG